MKKTYMLDTSICSLIIRERPRALLNVLQIHVKNKDRLVISAITYAELLSGPHGKTHSKMHSHIVEQFMERVDAVLPWDKDAAKATAIIKSQLAARVTTINSNDTAIAGNAIAVGCALVTNKAKVFSQIPNLIILDWSA